MWATGPHGTEEYNTAKSHRSPLCFFRPMRRCQKETMLFTLFFQPPFNLLNGKPGCINIVGSADR
jgi:hypothetical protein